MAITIKNLANDQLPAVVGDLYTVPAATTAIVRQIILGNTDVADRTVTLYYTKSGDVARFIRSDVIAAGKGVRLDFVLTMGTGDKISGYASAAAVVDIVISGIERT